jgi:DNA polymerase V
MIPNEELEQAAADIKETVETWTGIKVSVGVAPTKVLSKVANRLSKKNKKATNGVLVLNTPDKIEAALHKTKVEDIWGVGGRYAWKLKNLWGIETAWQLRKLPEEWARTHLGGVVGVRLLKELNGDPAVEMKDPLEKKKMIATTRMFGKPVTNLADLKEAVATYTSRAAEKLRRQYCAAKHIDVFVVSNNYENGNYTYNPASLHKYCTLPFASSNTNELIKHAVPLVEQLFKQGTKYLKTGVVLSGLVPDDSIQGNLFKTPAQNNNRRLMEAMDNINFSQRDDVLKFATSGMKRNWKMRQELRSPRYTTRWNELYEVR